MMANNNVEEHENKPPNSVSESKYEPYFSAEISKIEHVPTYVEKSNPNLKDVWISYGLHKGVNAPDGYKPFYDMLSAFDYNAAIKNEKIEREGKII